jgi:hypothetical protein
MRNFLPNCRSSIVDTIPKPIYETPREKENSLRNLSHSPNLVVLKLSETIYPTTLEETLQPTQPCHSLHCPTQKKEDISIT